MSCKLDRRAGSFAATLVVLLGVGVICVSRLGLLWSDGAGGLWGLTSGGWTSITLMPGTTSPPTGFLVGSQRNAAGNLFVGGQRLMPQRSSSLSLPVVLIPILALGAGIGVAVGRRTSRNPWQCRCGYDRRGLKDDAPCPECGRAPTRPTVLTRPA